MKNTRWWQYVNRLLGDDSYSAAADKAGFDKSAFTRWKKGAAADPAFVVKIARAYNKNVLEALVEAEFLTEEEARLTEVAPDLDLTKIDGALLAEELDRRIKVLNYLKNLSPNSDPDAELGKVVTDLANYRNDRSNTATTPGVPTEVDDDDLLAGINPEEHAAHPKTTPMETDHWT